MRKYEDPKKCHPSVCFSCVDKNFKKEDRDRYRVQRRERGFDDTELWNLDGSLVRFLLPRLRAFKESTVGYPGCDEANTFENWQKILGDMIEGLERYMDDDFREGDPEKIERAWCLLGRWGRHLWW